MLAWFELDETASPGQADRMIETLAQDLLARGWRLAGAVQRNLDRGADCACDMELHLLGSSGPPVRISQSLGPGASGCRLDTTALAGAAGRVAAGLAEAELVILPKFGRQEAAGAGFRDVIGRALSEGIPVLLHVPHQQRAAFAEFACGMGSRLAPDGLRDWCEGLRT
ncbi:DUF2478 domain-containing protein [Paracoccus sp. (in: a-proteobacteria)]|uniref:DUF2478 domain-containing protein n=1 Tax=Paracoccus sp. TaxID=267 RepID=UPI002729C3D9|nr:DUF2478 domain-containing protein [Paracoccus sp. (in: a-proteobacteria)]